MIVRHVACVIFGYVVMSAGVVLTTLAATAIFPGLKDGPSLNYIIANLIYSGFFAALGGWVTGFSAPNRPLLHAAVLGGICLMFSLAYLNMPNPPNMPAPPHWYKVALAFVVAPMILLGGFIRERQVAKKNAASATAKV